MIVAGLLRVSGASIFWFVFVANDKNEQGQELKVTKPVEVLFEGAHTDTYYRKKSGDEYSKVLVDSMKEIKENWNYRGYSFGVFKDPPGQVWADFVHKTDELIVLAEGEIEIEIEGN